jgi:hypothetical protein
VVNHQYLSGANNHRVCLALTIWRYIVAIGVRKDKYAEGQKNPNHTPAPIVGLDESRISLLWKKTSGRTPGAYPASRHKVRSAVGPFKLLCGANNNRFYKELSSYVIKLILSFTFGVTISSICFAQDEDTFPGDDNDEIVIVVKDQSIALQKIYSQSPPEGATPQVLNEFYMQQVNKARQIGGVPVTLPILQRCMTPCRQSFAFMRLGNQVSRISCSAIASVDSPTRKKPCNSQRIYLIKFCCARYCQNIFQSNIN